jgi:hypothetical protein
MKNFRWIGMAVTTFLLSIGLTACSSDDDDEEPIVDESGVVTNLKELVHIKYDDDETCTTYDMEYDSAGKLISVATTDEYDDQLDSWIEAYDWSNGLISSTRQEGINSSKGNLYLVNGLVRESKFNYGGYNIFTYDSNNKLKSVEYYDYNKTYHYKTFQFTWDGERLVEVKRINSNGEEEYQATITYSGKTCVGQCVIWNEAFLRLSEYEGLVYAHPEIFGIRTSELPQKIVEKANSAYDDDCTYDYQYEFTKDNYVSNIIITEAYSNGDTYTSKLGLSWK